MLVLTRKLQQQIQIGDDIVITLIQVKGQSVRIGIEAPKSTRVLRAELPRKAEDAEPAPAMSGRSLATGRRTPRNPVKAAPQTSVENPARSAEAPLARLLTRRAPDVDPASPTRHLQRPGSAPTYAVLAK